MNNSVCIFSPSQNIWGGGQIYIDNLCRYLNAGGFEAWIATSEPGTFCAPTIAIPSVAGKLNRIFETWRLVRKLKDRGIRVVLLNDLSSLWLAPIFRIYGFKVISLLHLYLQKRNAAGLGHGAFAYHFLRFSSRFVQKIYSVNKENQASFPVEIEFIGNFISPWFLKAPCISEKHYDLGLIARFSVEKNVPLFVELIAKLNSVSERPITALIVGKGEEEISVREAIEAHGLESLIELRPWVERENLPAIYDQLRCFAITSHHEGFATTLLEAHARGVPAITTHAAGFCAEFLTGVSPVTGLSFNPVDIHSEAFLRQVLVLINSNRDYAEMCMDKAAQFSEARVLGRIQAGVSFFLGGDDPGKVL